MKNRKIIAIELVVFGLILIGFISASGISPPYWEGYPLQMNYGETRVINFNLQNMVGTEDVNVKVVIKEGSDIASLEKTTYSAKIGTSDTLIPLKINIPSDYNKQVQRVSLEFNSVNPSEEGMVTIGTGWTTSFDVVLSEKPVEKKAFVWIIILLVAVVLVLALIIYLMLSRRKRN